MLSLHDQSRGPWILLHVALDKGRFNVTVCGRYIMTLIVGLQKFLIYLQ
jgi:hypothetical protein